MHCLNQKYDYRYVILVSSIGNEREELAIGIHNGMGMEINLEITGNENRNGNYLTGMAGNGRTN